MTTSSRSTVVGVFDDRAQAERAVDELERAGFTTDQVGFARKDGDRIDRGDTEAGETAGGGAVTGGVVGGLIGAALAGLIPGIGPVIAAGALASIVAGAAVGAATGGIAGALIGAGIPEDEAPYYEGEFQSGRTIVTVRAGNRFQEASDIMRRFGAYDVERRGMASTGAPVASTRTGVGMAGTGMSARRWEDDMPTWRSQWQTRYGTSGGRWQDYEPYYRYGWDMNNDQRYSGRPWSEVETDFRTDWSRRYPDKPWDRAASSIRDAWDNMTHHDRRDVGTRRADLTDTDANRRIQLKEEELRATKRDVEAGEVRVRKEVVTEQQTLNVPVRREEVVIERHAVEGRAASSPIGSGEEIRIPIREEVVDVEKRPVVREEINVGKRETQETQRVSDSVRREEAHIEREGDITVRGDGETRQSDHI